MFASAASLLSVISSLLSYCIEHRNDEDEMVAVQYYLGLERQPVASPGSPTPEEGAGNKTVRGIPGVDGVHRLNSVSSSEAAISDKEKKQILKFRGLRLKLSQSLTELWHIPSKTIEIGATVLTKSGAMTHIVHLMKSDDVEIYKSVVMADRLDIEVTETMIARRFYALRRDEVSEIFKSHFGLSEGFKVDFYDGIGRKKRAMTPSAFPNEYDLNETIRERRRTVNALFKTTPGPNAPNLLMMDTNGNDRDSVIESREDQLDIMLRAYFNDQSVGRGGMSIEEKRVRVIEMVNGLVKEQEQRTVGNRNLAVPLSDGMKRDETVVESVVNVDDDLFDALRMVDGDHDGAHVE